MKKCIALVLSLVLLMTCAASLADNLVEKDIQFGDYTFGMSFADAKNVAGFNSVRIDYQIPYVSRVISDPQFMNAAWMAYQTRDFCPSFVATANGKQVAGHDASITLYFRFPTAGDAQDYNISSGIFYAGTYDVYDMDNTSPYDDLKTKLTSVYGEPFMETEDANELWGEIVYVYDQPGYDPYADAAQMYTDKKFSVWKSSANNVMVVLMACNNSGWNQTQISYIDLSAEDLLTSLLGAPESKNSDVSGL